MQVAEIFQHVRADFGEFMGGFAGNRLRPVLLAQLCPVNFRTDREHCILPIKCLPQLVESRLGQLRRQVGQLRRQVGRLAHGTIFERSHVPGGLGFCIHTKKTTRAVLGIHVHSHVLRFGDHGVHPGVPA